MGVLDDMDGKLLSALRWIERQTHTRTNYPQMLVGLEEGLYLREFVRKTKSLRILEIGTFTGFSLCCLADGVLSLLEGAQVSIENVGRGHDVYVDAIEINKELDYIIEEGLRRAGVQELTKVFFSDAVSLLSEDYNVAPIESPSNGAGEISPAGKEYDFVFIDADKRQYPQYYELVLPLVKPGGYIVADNVSWYGKGHSGVEACDAGKADEKKSQTSGIVSFNHLVEEDPRVECRFVDIRDGLCIICKK